MLSIYTSKQYFSNSDFILDNDAYFKSVGFFSRELVEPIISAIDRGTWSGRDRFIDRFGVTLYSDFISTGSKTLINMASSDKVFCGSELGLNALEYMFLRGNGRVFITPRYFLEIPVSTDINRITVNDNPITSIQELEDLLCI